MLKGTITVKESAIDRLNDRQGEIVITNVPISSVFHVPDDTSIHIGTDEFIVIVTDNDDKNSNCMYVTVDEIIEYVCDVNNMIVRLCFMYNDLAPKYVEIPQIEPILKDIIVYKSVCALIFTNINKRIETKYKTFGYMDKIYHKQRIIYYTKINSARTKEIQLSTCIIATEDMVGNIQDIEEFIEVSKDCGVY